MMLPGIDYRVKKSFIPLGNSLVRWKKEWIDLGLEFNES
jgi:hypothetical protein